jgi:hypothetical protein
LLVAMLVALVGSLGCHRRLPAMLEAGRVDEVIARAESSRFAPRRKAARAYAEALVHRGNTDRARSVLLTDFRKGGHVPSLVALADLERGLGLDGVALLHYVRAAHLDRSAIAGRQDVCAMLRQRARELLRLGEALAAEEDLLAVRRLCGTTRPTTSLQDEELARAIDEAAHAQVRQRTVSARCPAEGCEPPPEADRVAIIDAAIDRAREEGPSALRHLAARLKIQLDPEDVVALLLAEARGEIGLELLPDHEVRAWIAGARWSELSSAVTARNPAETAWLQLRLGAVLDDMPVPASPSVGPSLRDKWADRALELPGAQRWRISAYMGELAAAELALAADHRPRAEGGETLSGDVIVGPSEVKLGEQTIPAPSHWAARALPSRRSLEAAIVLARLREAAGQGDRALEILRHALARAHLAGIDGVPQLAIREAGRELARGRPWHALAIADTLPLVAMRPVRAAAASGIALATVFCGGRCPDDPDHETVERVLGEAWIATMAASVSRLSRGSESSRAVLGPTCPTLGERLGPDAEGPVTDVLRRARRSLDGPGFGEAAILAIGSDLTLACAARQVLPLMAATDARLSAATLSDILAHAPSMRAAPMLQTHAELALVGGQAARAELLSVAAAGASRDAASTWAAIALRAHEMDARELERKALRELILHTPRLEHDPARQAMVTSALRDLARSDLVRASEVGRETARHHVSTVIASRGPRERWAAIEALARTVGRTSWVDPVRPVVVDVLLPTPELQAQHPVGMAWLDGGVLPVVHALDADALELANARGRASRLPKAVDAIADLAAFEGARRELAAHARDWTVRRRMIVGLAVYGSESVRAAAVMELDRMIGDDATRREALHELLLSRPAAMEPVVRGSTPNDDALPRRALIVEDEEALSRVIVGLDPSIVWFAGGRPREVQ